MKLPFGAVLLLHLLFVCDAAVAQNTASQRISGDWKRYVFDDLEAVGNAPEKDLRRALEEVHRFRGTLLALMPGLKTRSPERTLLVVLRGWDDFQRFAPRDGRGRRREVGGYFYTAPDGNFMVLPRQADRDATFVTIFHEYTHYLVYRNLHQIPTWLNEGLADLYSTFYVNNDGKVIIGRAPPGRVQALQGRSLLPLARLLDPETSTRLFENEQDTALFYSQAWAFVHFMSFGDKGNRRGQILKYLNGLQTLPPLEAAKAAFGDLAQVDSQLRTYTRLYQLPAIALNVRQTGAELAGRTEPMTEAEALHVQARLLLDMGASGEAEETLGRALKLDPGHLRARVALGRLRMRQDREAEAIALLRELAETHADDFEVQYQLGAALFSEGDYEDSLKSYDRAVALNRHSPSAWYGVSTSALALKRAPHANAAMRRVQDLYWDPSWYFGRAQFALGIGSNDAAAADVQEYLRVAGWGDTSAPYAAFIGVIAHWRLEQPSQADALLSGAARVVRPQSWAATVVQYLQGALTDAALLDRADDNGQRTEAHAYIGVKHLLAGRREEARKHFSWVKERGDRNYTEYGLAIAELKRLDRP